MGHVWAILMVNNWATFVFLKKLFVKNTIKIGVSADFLFKKKGEQKILMVNNWATLPIFKVAQTWPSY